MTEQRQRHVLTALFTDLVGSTSLGRRIEAEVLADLLDALRQVWHEAAQSHGGMVLRTQGDGALIVFGYPDPCEDGGRRAADAAFEIHERAADIRRSGDGAEVPPPQMRSGIAAGVVLVAAGDIERGRLDLVGDVANSAAGLLDLARPGGIVAHADALGPHASFFEHVALAQPNTLQLLGRKGVRRRFDATAARGLTPLIDRDQALQRVVAFVDHEAPSAGRCLLLEADAGMGKTRLLDELLQRVRGRVLAGTCESYMVAGALQPFVSMLGQHKPPAGVLGAESMPASPEHLLKIFRRWSTAEPLAIVVDDWQWADDASRQLVQALLQLPAGPLVLLACRPREDGARWIADAQQQLLKPLSLRGTEAAVRRWLPEVDPFLAERIHAHTGGVPLYIEELCHASSAATLAQSLDGEGGTPAWLAAWVAGRLKRLPAHQSKIVRAAAVDGVSVPLATLEVACRCTLDGETLGALADADLLYFAAGQSSLRFKHGLTREAVYESMSRAERQHWHGTLRAQLADEAGASDPADRDEHVEALAHHSFGAGLWPEAASYADRAGDRASAAFALDSARKWYLMAMEALDRVAGRKRDMSLKWCLISNKLGMTCIFDPLAQRNDARPFEKAVAIARELRDEDVLARALYWLGYMYYGFGRFRAGERQLRLARAVAERAGDARLATQVDATLAQVLSAASRYDEAIQLFDASLAAKQRQAKPGSSMAIGSAYALACKGSVLADRGEFDPAHRCFEEALVLLGETTHPVANSVRNWVAVACVWQGRWEEAEAIAAESARIAENTRSLLLLVVCRAAAGYARWARTGDPHGLDHAADAVNWMDARGGRFYTSLHHGWLVDAYATLGLEARARRHATHVLWRSREGERLGEASSTRALARLAIRAGRLDEASRWLARAQRSAEVRASRREAAMNRVVDASLAELGGDAARAEDLRQRARIDFLEMNMLWHAQQLE